MAQELIYYLEIEEARFVSMFTPEAQLNIESNHIQGKSLRLLTFINV